MTIAETWPIGQKVRAAMDEQDRIEAGYLARPLREITGGEHDHMLNCLPPIYWQTHEGVKVFCMMEMQIGDITSQFGERNGRYFTKYVNVRKTSTWMTAATIDAYIAAEADRDRTSPMPKSMKLVMQNELRRLCGAFMPEDRQDAMVEEMHEALYWAGHLKDT